MGRWEEEEMGRWGKVEMARWEEAVMGRWEEEEMSGWEEAVTGCGGGRDGSISTVYTFTVQGKSTY